MYWYWKSLSQKYLSGKTVGINTHSKPEFLYEGVSILQLTLKYPQKLIMVGFLNKLVGTYKYRIFL
jgi:hypothetical protein